MMEQQRSRLSDWERAEAERIAAELQRQDEERKRQEANEAARLLQLAEEAKKRAAEAKAKVEAARKAFASIGFAFVLVVPSRNASKGRRAQEDRGLKESKSRRRSQGTWCSAGGRGKGQTTRRTGGQGGRRALLGASVQVPYL